MTGDKSPSPRAEKRRLAICVFCGSSHGTDPAYAATAKALGEMIAARGYSLIFGGGDVGLMGEVARAARDGGAPVQGILPDFLKHLEPPLPTREKVVITPDLQSRKALMLSLADAFVVLPGGLGTLDEYFEILTSAQLGVFRKPIVVVDVAGYYAPLKALLDQVTAHGFAGPETLAMQTVVNSAEEAMAVLDRRLAA